jgi:ATP-dependent DNA helicase RecG
LTITPEQIDLWRNVPSETQVLEFKEAKSQFDNEKLFEYCVAIANEGGGHLLLGIRNNPPREVVGTSAFRDPQKMEEKILQVLRFRVDIEQVDHPEGRVLVFIIPSRPPGTPCHHKGAYYMRVGESLVPMDGTQLRKILEEKKPNWLEGHSRKASAKEVAELLNLKRYFELLNFPYPASDEAAVSRLAKEGLIDDLGGGQYGIRRLAAILLAKELAHFPELSRKAFRVIVYNGNSKLNTKLERQATSGYAVGFSNAVRFIGEQLPQNEVIENAIRKEVKLVPDDVIRELLANALIHQDFSKEGASVMVEIYDNRVEITNPGEPLVTVDRFIDGYRSRNELLAATMRRFGICEEKGSGIDKVVKTVEVFQLPAPDFRTGYENTVVTFFGSRDFEAMSRDDRIRACYQHCALKYVMNEQMTNQSLRLRFNLPESKSAIVSQTIAYAIEAKYIKQDEKVGGSRKFARYLPFWA